MTTIKIMARMNMPSAMRSLRCIRAFGCLESEDWHPCGRLHEQSPLGACSTRLAHELCFCAENRLPCENSGAHGVRRPTFAPLVGRAVLCPPPNLRLGLR